MNVSVGCNFRFLNSGHIWITKEEEPDIKTNLNHSSLNELYIQHIIKDREIPMLYNAASLAF
jgi:hypothetical protein